MRLIADFSSLPVPPPPRGKKYFMRNENSFLPMTRFVLVGGFLGAGKTTVIARLVRWLGARGLRCGLITNDQGAGLVDSALARRQTAAMAEITGGCFCCRLDDLVAAVKNLGQSERPDVFLAEPVGSCTDLMATVLQPLRRVYQMPLSLAPLAVLLDGQRAYRTLVERGRTRDFSKDVGYIYRKQIEEAEILVINKTDLLTAAQLEKLTRELEMNYPGRKIFPISARTGEGLDAWFSVLMEEGSSPHALMDVDYERYGVGEALLGWLNATVAISAARAGVSGADILPGLADEVMNGLEREGIEVAHFKMALEDESGSLLRVQVTRSGEKPELAGKLDGVFREGRLLVNLRAEGEPGQLAGTVSAALAKVLGSIGHEVVEWACFKPGQPVPTHRVGALA